MQDEERERKTQRVVTEEPKGGYRRTGWN